MRTIISLPATAVACPVGTELLINKHKVLTAPITSLVLNAYEYYLRVLPTSTTYCFTSAGALTVLLRLERLGIHLTTEMLTGIGVLE